MRALFAALALSLSCTITFAQAPTFREEWTSLRNQSREAASAKDYPRLARSLLQMNELIPGRPDTFYNLACAYALSGNKNEALRWLEKFASTGAIADPSKDPDLASLVTEPRFLAVLARIEKNRQPISHSSVFALFSDPRLLTEDIAYDPRSRSLFVTSILRKKIIRIDSSGRASDFADLSSDPGWPLMAVHADPARNTLWVTAAAMPGFVTSPPEGQPQSVLLKLDLRTGKVLQRISAPDSEKRNFGDMDIAPNGSVIVTDSRSAAIFLLPLGSSTLQRLDRSEFISPQTPAITPDSHYAYVADYARGIARLDLRSREIFWLKHPDTIPLIGTDGLVFDSSNKRDPRLIAIQNGTTPARLTALTLNRAGDTVENVEILESNYPELGEPTHAVLVGSHLYFIANSGWNFLDGQGNMKPGATMTPAAVRKLSLR